MKVLTLLFIIAIFAGWKIYERQSTPVVTNADLALLNEPSETFLDTSPALELLNSVKSTFLEASSVSEKPSPTSKNHHSKKSYSCDGRQHCSQMSSCAEAMFFIQNCPNTKMDGDHDGIPCEGQFCGH